MYSVGTYDPLRECYRSTKDRNMRPRWLMVIGDMKATCRIREPGCHTPDGVCVSHGLVVKREMTRWRNWSGVKRSSIFAPADGFLHSTFTRRLTTPPSLPRVAHPWKGTRCRVLWVLMPTRTMRSVGRPSIIDLLNSREALRRLMVLCYARGTSFPP